MSSRLWVFVFTLLVVSSFGAKDGLAKSAAGPSPVPPAILDIEEWPGKIRNGWEDAKLKGVEEFHDFVFKEMREIGTTFDVGKSSLKFKIGRQVYANYDICQTYSVVDSIGADLNIPIFNDTVTNISDDIPVGFYFGTPFGIEAMNIRQVYPDGSFYGPDGVVTNGCQNYRLHTRDEARPDLNDHVVETRKEREDSFKPLGRNEEMFERREDLTTDAEFFYHTTDEGEKTSVLSSNPEKKAHYKKIFNMVTFPFRVPTKAEELDRMDGGEVFSYLVYGGVEFGPHVGWKLTEGTMEASVGLSWRTIIKGIFRITILKENHGECDPDAVVPDNELQNSPCLIRLKVQKTQVKGRRLGLSGEFGLSGFVVFDDLLELDEKFVQFSISKEKQVDQSFDTVYQYDISKEDALEAYQKALLGRLQLSDKMAHSVERVPLALGSRGVRLMAEQESNSSTVTRASKLELDFFTTLHERERTGVTRLETISIKTVAEDGTVTEEQIDRAGTKSTRAWENLWGNKESWEYSFDVNIDRRFYEANPHDLRGLTMTVTGQRVDVKTDGDEYLEDHALWTEQAIGKFGVVPRLPSTVDVHQNGVNLSFFDFWPRKNIGRARTQWRFFLDGNQMSDVLLLKWECSAIGGGAELWEGLDGLPHEERVARATARAYCLDRKHFDGPDSNDRAEELLRPAFGSKRKVNRKIKAWGELLRKPTKAERKRFEGTDVLTNVLDPEMPNIKLIAIRMVELMETKGEGGKKWVKFLRSTLSLERIPYEVIMNNRVFGNVVRKGFSNSDETFDVAEKHQAVLEFNRRARRDGLFIELPGEGIPPREIPLGDIDDKNANISQLSAREQRDGTVRITFRVAQQFFEMADLDRTILHIQLWGIRQDGNVERVLGDLFIEKPKFLVQGENEILLDRTDVRSPWQPLAKMLRIEDPRSGEVYDKFKVRISSATDNFLGTGAVIERDFRISESDD